MTQSDPESNPRHWRDELASLRADAAELAAARAELARLEWATTVQMGKRWAIVAGGCALVTIAGTTLLLSVGGEQLAKRFGGSPVVWQSAVGLVCVVLGVGGLAWLARRIRRNFRPFSGLSAELQEDAIWLKEWLGSDSSQK
jgi:hypothetical protein